VKRFIIVPVAIAAVLATAGLAQAGGGQANVQLRKTKAGMILANGRGFTLYEFTKDTPGKDNCVSNPTCARLWPPLTTKGKIVAGKGVKRSLLGTIKLPNGKTQVTYAGRPLYTYIADGGPGETSYIGVFQSGGRWYAMDGAGHLVKKKRK
jgi:predicted lipoprotein with Yx(FWY)xxD motif